MLCVGLSVVLHTTFLLEMVESYFTRNSSKIRENVFLALYAINHFSGVSFYEECSSNGTYGDLLVASYHRMLL